jgi:hypothetical protein
LLDVESRFGLDRNFGDDADGTDPTDRSLEQIICRPDLVNVAEVRR